MTPEAIAGILGASVGAVLTGIVSWRIYKTSTQIREKAEASIDL